MLDVFIAAIVLLVLALFVMMTVALWADDERNTPDFPETQPPRSPQGD